MHSTALAKLVRIAATQQILSLNIVKEKKNKYKYFYLFNMTRGVSSKSPPWRINNTVARLILSQSGADADGLSQHCLLMHCEAGPPVCLRWLIFPAGFSFNALRWAFKRLLRRRRRPPSDFPSLSPPVRCPFQWLIYGPHKCARDAEIS